MNNLEILDDMNEVTLIHGMDIEEELENPDEIRPWMKMC